VRTWDKLSATGVKGLKRPGKYYDGGGLMLQVSAARANGVTKAWLFRYQIDHRERVMGIGSARVVSLAGARAKANELRKLLAAGIDPISHRDAERMAARAAELHTATFKAVLDQLLESHGDKWRQKHAAQYRNSMATYSKPLFDVAVGDVDTAMVIKVIEPEWKRAPQTMDRVRRRIGEVLGFAEVRGLRKPGPLPTRWKNHLDKLLPHPRALKPVVHHAALKYDAVPGLFARLTESGGIPELCLAFTALTAVRSAESRGAKWSEIDFTGRIWVVPAERMKRQRPHRVALSAEALALIERLPRQGEHLFAINGSGKPIVAMTLRKTLARHGGAGATVHGLRSAFRTWADDRTGYPREIKEAALGHAIGNAVVVAYARGDLLEKRRRLMADWGRFLASPPTASAGVVPLGGRRNG
jgi:integrase